jgi:hypothetical protein
VLVSAAGDGVWDGVAAAPLARALRAPLLVVPRGTAAASVAASLGGRRVTTAVLVGAVAGPARPGPLVAALQAEGVSVTRLAGADRFATAALVAEQVVARSADPAGSRRAVVVPTDGATPDAALAAAAVAAGTGRPVLLTRARTLPAATSGAVTALGIASAVCVGSAAELSDAVARALPACRRVASADPVQLGTRLAGTVRPASPWTAVTLAVPGPGGTADAVAAAALGRPLLRVGPRAPSVAVRWLQTARSVGRLTVVGDVPGGAVRALQRA